MQIGYDVRTLWRQIAHQYEEIQSETDWLNHYVAIESINDVENCAKNIADSCKAILENIEYLKGEEL